MLQPRVIVTTDPELDDLNSMLRLLLYSNEIDLVGLVYCSSEHHYRGDPASGVTPKRWPAESDTLPIDQAIAAYAEVHHNLVAHDHRYPSPAHLASLVRMGNVANVGDMEHPTPGSDLIAEVLLDDNPRPVFVQAWGGMNTIARALRSIEDTHIDRPEWPDIYERVTNKTVMTGFGFQDSTYEDYIEGHWPEIEHRQVATMVWGYFAWNVVPDADAYRLSAAWTREHVSNVGPMGAAYRVWGDGGQMAAGFDDEDYFGIAGRTREELEAEGYRVWCPLHEQGSWISEGDSSNFALHIDNGLRSWEHANHGGWGGRQAAVPGSGTRFDSSLAKDRAPDGSTPDDYHAARWFGAFQDDFAARLQWSVTSDVTSVNHHPRLEITQGLDLIAAPGASIVLTAVTSDPDGDDVNVTWWWYPEAGSCPGHVEMVSDGNRCTVTLPTHAGKGQTIHVIAEATDTGSPPLTCYRRVIIMSADHEAPALAAPSREPRVEARATSSGWNMTWRCWCGSSEHSSMSNRAEAAPTRRAGWRTELSGGVTTAANSASS